MRGVGGTERQVGEERPVGAHRLRVVHEADGVIDEVLGEVVPLLDRARRLDPVVVVRELGVELVGLPVEEAVVPVEPALQGPLVVGAGGRRALHGGEVPLADRERRVALVAQDLGDRRRVVRDVTGHVGEAGDEVRDRSHAGEEET